MSHPLSKNQQGFIPREKRLYVSSMPTDTPQPGAIVRNHWSIESMHWGLDYNLQQDNIKTQVGKSRPKPRHHTKNSLLGVLNMERTPQKTIGTRIKA